MLSFRDCSHTIYGGATLFFVRLLFLRQVRADVFCYLVKDETAAAIGIAINKVRLERACEFRLGSLS